LIEQVWKIPNGKVRRLEVHPTAATFLGGDHQRAVVDPMPHRYSPNQTTTRSESSDNFRFDVLGGDLIQAIVMWG
jgi:hypothetical protein